jgi:hypothetical protein
MLWVANSVKLCGLIFIEPEPFFFCTELAAVVFGWGFMRHKKGRRCLKKLRSGAKRNGVILTLGLTANKRPNFPALKAGELGVQG